MADRLVQILARDDACELAGSPTRMPLWRCCWQSTIACATVSSGGDEPRRARHDLAGGERPAHGVRAARRARARARVVERAAVDGRGRLRMPAAAERAARARRRRARRRGCATTQNDALVHLDEADEAARVGEVDELVGEVRDRRRRTRARRPRRRAPRSRRPRASRARRAARRRARARCVAERRVEVLRDHVLPRAVAQAPGERVGVALASPPDRSASPCPRGCRARTRSPRAASARSRARRGCRRASS